jgi:hypothetical protein
MREYATSLTQNEKAKEPVIAGFTLTRDEKVTRSARKVYTSNQRDLAVSQEPDLGET